MTRRKGECRLLTIGGSDNTGGAGVQADLKTFCLLGAYGMSAITLVSAQSTIEFGGLELLPVPLVQQQIQLIRNDIGMDAIKTGMLWSAEMVKGVADTLYSLRCCKVIDPVMVNGKGQRLVSPETITAYKTHLIPQATVITPNLQEAALLLGQPITDQAAQVGAAKSLLDLGCACVIVKGGPLPDVYLTDTAVWRDEAGDVKCYHSSWLKTDTRNTRGTGDTLSAALAVFLAHGFALVDAMGAAAEVVQTALAEGAKRYMGEGNGPLDHGALVYNKWRVALAEGPKKRSAV